MTHKRRRIAVVTGTRADYGLLSGILQEIQHEPRLELQLIVTGMHLSPEFGNTYQQIEVDGFEITERVELLLSGDSAVAIAKSIGLGTIGFADAYARLNPDLVVLLGDRFEILAAAQAALVALIPIAHLHGGEVTEGAFDEAIRHSITKMASLHFVAAEPFRQRVIQLGEPPERVFTVGAPGLDNIRQMKLLTRVELETQLGFGLGETTFLVTYHPETLSKRPPSESMGELLSALDSFPDAKVVITYPNADTSGRILIDQIRDYSSSRKERILAIASLGQLRYLSLMSVARVVIGNSSSGLIEAPSFALPTVNLGGRQGGRLRAASVIDCTPRAPDIIKAIEVALSPGFRASIERLDNPYGDGRTAPRVVEQLCRVELEGLCRKRFHDIEQIDAIAK